jgi:hypothetical protein
VACGGSNKAKPDAGSGSGSGSGSNLCTGALYDPCTGSGCMAGLKCMDFQGRGVMACVEDCPMSGQGSSCPAPTGSGISVICNGMDECAPSATNDCTPL